MFSAEDESLRHPIDEMTDISNLNASAADLAGSLTWLPDQFTDQPFRERCQSLITALRPLLEAATPRPAGVP